MNKILLIITALVTLSSGIFAQEPTTGKKMPSRFQAVPMAQAHMVQEGEGKNYCPKCGMTLPMFYKTNHVGDVNGTTHQFCSIHCLAETMHDKNVTHLKVVDTKSLKLIDASNAWYVVGSSKAGTMSKVSKYAFNSKEDAQGFSKKFGGEVFDFETTLSSVKKNLAKETAMIHKKQAMMAKKGKQMFTHMCRPIGEKFLTIAQAKSYIQKHEVCGKIKGKKLQAIALYLVSSQK